METGAGVDGAVGRLTRELLAARQRRAADPAERAAETEPANEDEHSNILPFDGSRDMSPGLLAEVQTHLEWRLEETQLGMVRRLDALEEYVGRQLASLVSALE